MEAHGPIRELIDETEGQPTSLIEALTERLDAIIEEGLGRPQGRVCVVLVDDAEIRSLNRQWRGVDEATDVLSFAMQEGGMVLDEEQLGDIVISVETAASYCAKGEHERRVAGALGVEASRLSWEILDELTFLMIHGALHLLGHDHALPEEARMMMAEEGRIFRPFARLAPL